MGIVRHYPGSIYFSDLTALAEVLTMSLASSALPLLQDLERAHPPIALKIHQFLVANYPVESWEELTRALEEDASSFYNLSNIECPFTSRGVFCFLRPGLGKMRIFVRTPPDSSKVNSTRDLLE